MLHMAATKFNIKFWSMVIKNRPVSKSFFQFSAAVLEIFKSG